MAKPEEVNSVSSVSVSVSDAVRSEVRKQLRAEVDGEPITTAERFALEQKYGLADVVLLTEEKQLVEVSNGR
jgi:hypothetical protein